MSGFDDWVGRNVPDHIMEQAASWMALLDSDTCTLADRVTFSRWLSEDPMHQGAFEELSEVWASEAMLDEIAAHPDLEALGEPVEVGFDASGSLLDFGEAQAPKRASG